MLTEKGRKKIFGIALESTIEMGDALKILKEIQNSDFAVATLTFKSRWEKIVKNLDNVGAWVTRWEALTLIDILMRHYGITNSEIWEEVLHTDLTLHLWDYTSRFNRLLEERNEADPERRKEIDRIAIIRTIIATYMVDTRYLQTELTTKRNLIIYRREMGKAVKKIIHYKIRTDAQEFKELLKQEFPHLSDERLADFDKFFAKHLDSYTPVEVKLPPPPKDSIATIEQKLKDAEKQGLPLEIESIEEPDSDDLFDRIILPDFQTKEAEEIIDYDKFFEIKMGTKKYEVSTDGIIEILKMLIPEFGIEEIQQRTFEELKTFQKHSLDHDMLGLYWKIINETEKKLLKIWKREIQTLEMKKLGKIISALSMYKISLGNNTALLAHLKKGKK